MKKIEQAATQVFNGLIHLTDFDDAGKFEVLVLVRRMAAKAGHDSIARMVMACLREM